MATAAACIASLGDVSAEDELGRKAVAVLEKYCAACHGADVQKGGLRLDTAEGLKSGGDSGEPLLGNSAETSLLWARLITDGDMPPEDKPQPTAEEKQAVAEWLRAGAAWPGAGAALAAEAEGIFRKYCNACHGRAQMTAGTLDFDNFASLIAPRGKNQPLYLVPGNLNASLIWKKIASSTMPPKGRVSPSEAERTVLQDWILAGAPRWPQQQLARVYVSEKSTQEAILAHLEGLRVSDRIHQRYFSFTHLHNNPVITDEELALHKAALAKLLNSLTWESEIVIPQPVDPQRTVYVVDLRALDWTHEDHWSKLFERGNGKDGYPFGLIHNDQALVDLRGKIEALSGSSLATLRVRADWFISKAARPPLYHELLELPDNLTDLEERLEVTTEDDFLTPDLMRGAVIRSKVSRSNRLLDRHRALHGAYWISYDFAKNTGDGDLTAKPLGPIFDNNPHNDFAFDHDGGEVVFTLPNGMHGYFLVDGEKQRISEGPIEIVQDLNMFSGTPQVVTGVSCIGCHKHGVVRFEDEIGQSFNRNPSVNDKVRDLFKPVEQMNERLQKDEEAFLAALLEAVNPFLPVTTVAELRTYPHEPVGEAAIRYGADLTLADIAAELDITDANGTRIDPQELERMIKGNRTVERLIGSILGDRVIKRQRWEEKNAGGNSIFQTVAAELLNVAASD